MNDISDLESLRAHLGKVSDLAAKKVQYRLDRHCHAFIALSPFLVIATADRDGRMDASPRGDPPGFVQVLDDTTLLLPDRPGNNRADTFSNLTSAPGVGLIFFVPGIDETFRVNGTASLTADPERLAACEVNGRAPKTGMLIHIEEAFFHCAKALRRSRLWDPAAQVERSSFPSLGQILAEQLRTVTVADAEERVETAYRERMY